MKKTLIQVGLSVLILVAAYMLYSSLNAPIVFASNFNSRSEEVIQKLKDIRVIQRAYKVKNGTYSNNFDELISFVKNDSLIYEVASGSADDSLAVAEGRVTSYEIAVAARDTLFVGRTVNFDELAIVPHSGGKKFELGVVVLTTESGVDVNVFEAKTEYNVFLGSIPNSRQDLINLYDKRDTEGRYAGLKVGSLEKANNDAGNWE